MTFLIKPEEIVEYHADFPVTTEYKDETCVNCGHPLVGFKRVPVTYKVQMHVFDAVTQYGAGEAEKLGLRGTLFEVWLRASPYRPELEAKWLTNSSAEAVELAFKLRDEFKVKGKSFVLGLGPASKQTDSPIEMKAELDAQAVLTDTYRTKKEQVAKR